MSAPDNIKVTQTASVIPVIAGPTAVGKTSISILVGCSLGSEIISADSRQVFRDLRIGTARPEDDELEAIPHHFIAEKNISEPFSAGIFAREAEERIADIIHRGSHPLAVGGSTLYLSALTDGLADIPDVSAHVREGLNHRLRMEGPGVLFEELTQVDALFAATLDPTKSQRIVRGLEVWHGTGRPLSEYFAMKRRPAYRYQYFILDRARADLYDRINVRVLKMIEAGLVNEVATLLNAGVNPNHNALQTIGYREVVSFLESKSSEEAMINQIQQNSRRYAKRQLTWFRKIPGAIWIDATKSTDGEAAQQILSKLAGRNG